MNQPTNQPDQSAEWQRALQRSRSQPPMLLPNRHEPTAWESIPAFIRFATWVIAILTVLWLVVLPVLFVGLLAVSL